MEQLTQLAAIAGTVGLLWFTLQGLKRFRTNEGAGRRVSVQQRVSLANGCQLVVVRWDNEELLLATGNHPCTVVASKPGAGAGNAGGSEQRMGTLVTKIVVGLLLTAVSWGAPTDLLTAATRSPAPTMNAQQATLGVPMQIVLLLSGLTLLPVLLMSVTPFLRITLVLHFLRQAIGTQATPSNQVLIGLAMFLTMMIMQPTLQKSYEEGWLPYDKGR